MDNFAKVKYICPKCLYYINGKCEYPDVCCNFNRFKQDNTAEIKALKAEIKKLKKEIDNLKNKFRED